MELIGSSLAEIREELVDRLNPWYSGIDWFLHHSRSHQSNSVVLILRIVELIGSTDIFSISAILMGLNPWYSGINWFIDKFRHNKPTNVLILGLVELMGSL